MQLIPSGRSQHSELPNGVKWRACWMTTTSPTPTWTRWLALQAIMWLMISCRPGQQSRRACWPQGLGQLKATLRVLHALQRPVKKTIYKRKPKTINVDKNYSEHPKAYQWASRAWGPTSLQVSRRTPRAPSEERKAGDGSEQPTGACRTQGDWASWSGP